MPKPAIVDIDPEVLKNLWIVEAKTADQIAQALGTTRSAVLGRVHRLGLQRGGRRAPYKPWKDRRVVKAPEIKKEPPAPPPRVSAKPVSIEELESSSLIVSCRYIVQDRPTLYCGDPTEPGTSWCPHHQKIVWRERP